MIIMDIINVTTKNVIIVEMKNIMRENVVITSMIITNMIITTMTMAMNFTKNGENMVVTKVNTMAMKKVITMVKLVNIAMKIMMKTFTMVVVVEVVVVEVEVEVTEKNQWCHKKTIKNQVIQIKTAWITLTVMKKLPRMQKNGGW